MGSNSHCSFGLCPYCSIFKASTSFVHTNDHINIWIKILTYTLERLFVLAFEKQDNVLKNKSLIGVSTGVNAIVFPLL